MKTPYKQKRIERIIATALARRFSHGLSEEQGEEIIAKQEAMFTAQNELRMTVEKVIDSLLR